VTTVVFFALGAAIGVLVGWVVRARSEVPPPDDPRAELVALRAAHAEHAETIRRLNLEVARLEASLATARIKTVAPDAGIEVSDDDVAGAARIATIMEALGSLEAQRSAKSQDEPEPAPAAGPPDGFMSILPDTIADRELAESTARVDEAQSPPARAVTVDLTGDLPVVVSRPMDGARPRLPHLNGVRPAPDDLTRIKGIGPKLAALLAGEGITTFHQLARLAEDDIDRLEAKGPFRGRIRRDDWVGSARRLVSGARVG
jgi:predicted flap endonuclease-1-like 5' DNA nuclease